MTMHTAIARRTRGNPQENDMTENASTTPMSLHDRVSLIEERQWQQGLDLVDVRAAAQRIPKPSRWRRGTRRRQRLDVSITAAALLGSFMLGRGLG